LPGDCQPIIDLLDHLCNTDPEIREWILDWIAYPLQNPGAKMPTSVIMHGDEGSGKNLFWEIVQAIYGEYGSVVGQDQLEDKFNDWISRKLFIIGDEVLSRQEMRHLKGKLKAMISGTEIKINTKMMPVRSEFFLRGAEPVRDSIFSISSGGLPASTALFTVSYLAIFSLCPCTIAIIAMATGPPMLRSIATIGIRMASIVLSFRCSDERTAPVGGMLHPAPGSI